MDVLDGTVETQGAGRGRPWTEAAYKQLVKQSLKKKFTKGQMVKIIMTSQIGTVIETAVKKRAGLLTAVVRVETDTPDSGRQRNWVRSGALRAANRADK